MNLSEKEEELYNFIKNNGEKGVTIKEIEITFGSKAIGGIGKLIKTNKIKKVKIREGTGYNIKSITYYMLSEENK